MHGHAEHERRGGDRRTLQPAIRAGRLVRTPEHHLTLAAGAQAGYVQGPATGARPAAAGSATAARPPPGPALRRLQAPCARPRSAVRSSSAERRRAKADAPLGLPGAPGDARQEKETTPWDT